MFAIFSPIAWVRDLETFKAGFVFGFAMIVITIVVISSFCVSMNMSKIVNTPGFVPINESSYWSMIGFSFFMFEGIGGLMPLMAVA